MKSEIKVGDRVSWGGPPREKPDGSRIVPLRVGSCVVVEIGFEADDTGEPAARIRLPAQLGGETVGARIAELEIES